MRQIHGLLLVLLLTTFVVWATGCSDDENPGDPGNANCLVEPATLDFGDVLINTTATDTVTIKNIGEGTLVGTAALFNCGDEFAITQGAGGYSLEAGEELLVVVTYSPTTPGDGNCGIATGSDECSAISVAAAAFREPITEEITDTADVEERNPSYSPNGDWIVYEVAETDKQGDHDLWKINVAAGTDPEALTWGDYFDTEPSWADDGVQIVFESNRPQNQTDYKHLWIIEVTSVDGVPTALTSGAFHDGSPAWSPDGSHIVYVSNSGGAQDDLWLINMEGEQPGTPFALTTTGSTGYSRSPDWSPDSQWVVFESNVEGQSALYKIPVGGGDPTRLTELTGSEGHPAWSPNTEFPEIAYEAIRDDMSNIWVINVDGTEAQQVTTDGGNWPQWHPDGAFIIYGIAADPEQNLWTLAVDWH